MQDLNLVIDAALYVRIEKVASLLNVSVAEWLSYFFDNSGCPNPIFCPNGLSQPEDAEE